MGSPGLAGPVGLDAADRLGGGPEDAADIVAAEIDGDGVVGDVDGDDPPGVDAAEGDLLPGDHDDAGVAGPPWHGDGSADGRGGGPAGLAPRMVQAWSRVSGLGRVRSSSRVAGSKNMSVCSWMRAPALRPPRISAAMTDRPARCTWPSLETTRSASIAAPGWALGSGGGPAGRAPVAASLARSAVDRWERTDLTRSPATVRWITSVSAQNVMTCPARRGPSQNWRPVTSVLPLGGTTRSNSTGPPS